jgi:hypothetical protein
MNLFACASGFALTSVAIFSVGDRNIPRYLLHRDKKDEIYLMVKKRHEKLFYKLYMTGSK